MADELSWPQALHYVVYLHNIMPTEESGISPIVEVWARIEEQASRIATHSYVGLSSLRCRSQFKSRRTCAKVGTKIQEGYFFVKVVHCIYPMLE